jgi:hypothetical protein
LLLCTPCSPVPIATSLHRPCPQSLRTTVRLVLSLKQFSCILETYANSHIVYSSTHTPHKNYLPHIPHNFNEHRLLMEMDLFWKQSTNDTETRFCPDGEGAWTAVQTLIAFLVTNILAHAATIRFPAGSSTATMVLHVIDAILLPVIAGDSAFHAIGRLLIWLKWSYRERHKARLDRKPLGRHLSVQRAILRSDCL